MSQIRGRSKGRSAKVSIQSIVAKAYAGQAGFGQERAWRDMAEIDDRFLFELVRL